MTVYFLSLIYLILLFRVYLHFHVWYKKTKNDEEGEVE
jgi:hypothetical protein